MSIKGSYNIVLNLKKVQLLPPIRGRVLHLLSVQPNALPQAWDLYGLIKLLLGFHENFSSPLHDTYISGVFLEPSQSVLVRYFRILPIASTHLLSTHPYHGILVS